ncbi:hypothetical protein SMCF_4036 [Streptomyces coelicoflavus ZG0656]|nr:hypothetical protein SMCF_4036 [Streptomyces coelicoflavus ZG0656]
MGVRGRCGPAPAGNELMAAAGEEVEESSDRPHFPDFPGLKKFATLAYVAQLVFLFLSFIGLVVTRLRRAR